MKKIIGVLLLAAIAAGAGLYGWMTRPIKIGFVGELSTTASQLSVESREAFLYAVEQFNQDGGVNGRKLVPYIYDNQNDNAYKETLNAALKKDDIHLIIGFNISAMVETVEYLMANGDYLIISPTVTTDYMTGKDDRFIKTSPTNALQADALFEAVKQHDVKRMLIVYNAPNQLFAKGIVDKMTDLLVHDGRQVAATLTDSGEVDVAKISAAVVDQQADGVFVVLNGSDTAQVVQDLRIKGYAGPIFTTAWAATTDLLDNTGRYGEGVYSVEIKTNHPDMEARALLAGYIKERTNSELNFSHTRAYNSTKILIEALRASKRTDPEAVKQMILKIGTFQGIETQLSIDANGDTLGDYELQMIRDGKFVKVR